MKNLIKLTIIASISALAFTTDTLPPLKLLIQVSTAGASTPSTLFNKTAVASDEPKLTDYLTPLGQR